MAEIRGLFTFPGGVHPPERKHFTENRPIEAVPVPKQVAVPLSQHLGGVCVPTVAKKDTVTAGRFCLGADPFAGQRYG